MFYSDCFDKKKPSILQDNWEGLNLKIILKFSSVEAITVPTVFCHRNKGNLSRSGVRGPVRVIERIPYDISSCEVTVTRSTALPRSAVPYCI